MMKAIGKQIWKTRSRKRAASRPELNPHVIVDCGSITCGPTNVSSIDPWKRKCHVTNTIIKVCFYILDTSSSHRVAHVNRVARMIPFMCLRACRPARLSSYVRTCMHVDVRACVRAYIRTYVFIDVRTCMHPDMHALVVFCA